ncbi:hypothetical protein Tco_0378835 [Tanacetum coccineum]
MVFTNDIVLVVESVDGLNKRLESLREALEDNGLRGRNQTIYVVQVRVLADHESSSKQGGSGEIENAEIREGSLRWFGHVKRRPQKAPVRRVEALLVDGLRRRVDQNLDGRIDLSRT